MALQRKYHTIIILVGLGLTAGVLGGLLGIGGGALVVPGLVFFLGLSQHKAHGTSLAVVLFMSTAGSAAYALDGHVDWLLAAEMALGGIAGATVGARIVRAIKGQALRRIFGLFMMLVGVRMVLSPFMGGSSGPETAAAAALHAGQWEWLVLALCTGVATGVLSSILGVGGGIVMVPAMSLLLGLPQHTAQGISLAAMLPTALTGMLMHQRMGNVELQVAKWVGVGGAAGALIGATVAKSLDAGNLKLAFGVFMVIMAILMLLKKTNEPAPAEH